jgi:hypothetical protein
MKIERKLFIFSTEKLKQNGNTKTEPKLYKTEMTIIFFGGSRNGTPFSSGNYVETEFLFPTNVKFPFKSCFA